MPISILDICSLRFRCSHVISISIIAGWIILLSFDPGHVNSLGLSFISRTLCGLIFIPVSLHSAIGKSRSTTCVMAYLMQRYRLTPEDALARIRQSRPMCEPNSGFMQQLELYHRMGCPDSVEEHQLYQRWRYERELKRGLTMGQAPESIRFADAAEVSSVDGPVQMELRCRQCRYVV